MLLRTPICLVHFVPRQTKISLDFYSCCEKYQSANEKQTYDVSQREAECEIWGDCMHPVEHVCLIGLILELDVTIVEILLDRPLCLCHPCIRGVHHEHTAE